MIQKRTDPTDLYPDPALQRIEHWRRHGEPKDKLDLSRLQLTSLPPELFDLAPRLACLDLCHNRLTALPPEIERLTSLMLLFLDHNQIQTFPPEFNRLTSLIVLSTCGNPLIEQPRVPPGCIIFCDPDPSEDQPELGGSLKIQFFGSDPDPFDDQPEPTE